MSSDYELGERVRQQVMGPDYIAATQVSDKGLDGDFREHLVSSAWGGVWARPGLDLRTRSIITIAVLTALGRYEQLPGHIAATKNTGVTPQEVAEVLIHVSAYAGMPVAVSAFEIAKRVLGDPATPAESQLPVT